MKCQTTTTKKTNIMAYISTEAVKEIRSEIKRLFPKQDGWKFSVRKRDNMEVCVTILEGPETFGIDEIEDNYRQVNRHHFADHYSGYELQAIETIMACIQQSAAGVNVDYNAGDMGADYCNYNYFISINIGEFDRPYKCTAK